MRRLHQAFKNISQIEPSETLRMAVLSQIKAIKTKSIRQQLALSYAGLASSSLAFIYTVFTFGQIIIKSDFWNLVKLLFSDAGIVIRNWSDYAFSLLENFPAASIIAILLPVFILMVSISQYLKINNQRHKLFKLYSYE